MILGMYQNKINRYFATALIHTDKHGLYIMRAFCGICGVLHQPINVLPHSFSGGLQRLHRQTAGLTGVNDGSMTVASISIRFPYLLSE